MPTTDARTGRITPAPWIPTRTTALKIAAGYAAAGSVWILGSGWVLYRLVRNPELEATIETMKGWLFVMVTALLLWLALSRYFGQIRHSARLLQESEERWKHALDGAGQAAWDWNPQTNAVFYSASWKSMLGYAPGEIGDTIREWESRVHPEDLPRVQQEIARHLAGGSPSYSSEHRMRCKDGSYKWIHDRGKVMLRDAEDRPLRVLGTHADITDRKHLEQQLRQVQKLEAIGQLAGGVAHDFNNILAATMMHLGLLQMNPRLDEETRQALKDLETEARRAAALTRQLLVFSRRSALDMRPVDLDEVVRNLLRMLGRLIGEKYELLYEFRGKLPAVEADPGTIEQVITNLVVNARDAMPHGGRIVLGLCTLERSRHGTSSLSDPLAPGTPRQFVQLSVADTGCGMDPETQGRVFDPFFTTKEPGKGTGLGLATVHGIVTQHHGWVEIQSEVGSGTTFRVLLPALAAPAPAPADATPEKPLARGSETLIVVEDAPQVRAGITQGLRALGYEVHEAADAAEALRVWKDLGTRVDLVLTDMVMPGEMSGLELVRHLQSLTPNLRAIISSGYSAELGSAGPLDLPGVAYLPKPFEMKALTDLVRAQIDRRG